MQGFDIVICGGGLGGLAAACYASMSGLDALVVEKSDLLGGVGSYSGGFVWAPMTNLARASGYEDSGAEVNEYLSYVGGRDQSFDRGLRQSFIHNAARAVDKLAEGGVDFELTNRPDHYFPDAPGSKSGGRTVEASISGDKLGEWRDRLRGSPHWRIGLKQSEIERQGGKRFAYENLAGVFKQRVEEDFLTMGPGLTGALLYKAVADGNVSVLLESRPERLILQGDRVVGVTIKSSSGGEEEVRARRGVLLAMGSYGWSKDAVLQEALPGLGEQSPPVIHGDAFALVSDVGARIARTGRAFLTLGFESSSRKHPGTDTPLHLQIYDSVGFPHSAIVNRQGRRFGDETFYASFTDEIRKFDSVKKIFPNYPCYLVCDDRYRSEFWRYVRGVWPEEDFMRANSVTELAEKLDLPAGALERQVNEFNLDVVRGMDSQFDRGSEPMARRFFAGSGKGNPTLGEIERPPFWGTRLELVGAGIYPSGLVVDADARVQTHRREPIPGLYATGNTVAYRELGYGYEGGFANARNLAYAYAAVQHAGSQDG